MERRHDILRGYPNVATRTQKKKKIIIIIMNTSKETNKQTKKQMKRLCSFFIWVECIKFTYLIVVSNVLNQGT